jgi:cyanophycinase
VSIHLVGGGWSPAAAPEVYGGFVAEAASRAAGSGRMVPRIGVLQVLGVDDDREARLAQWADVLDLAGPNHVAATAVLVGEAFGSAVLSDIDGLLVAGGLTPAYAAALAPLVDEIRLLVADGLPYLGFSAGAMVAADRAVIGGWRIDGVPVCPANAAEDLDAVTVVAGLGLVDLAVDVHAAQWGTLGRLVAATEAGLVEGGVAIDEDTVLVVGDTLRVAGAGSVWQVVEGDEGVVVGTIGA